MVMRVAADKATLIWARKRMRLPIERAAELLNCDPGLLSKIELGEVFPNATLFRRMSDVYVLPEATLLGVTQPMVRELPKDFRSFEGATVELSYETLLAIRSVELRQETLAFIADMDSALVAPNLPIYTLRDNPSKLGEDFRMQLGFPLIDQLRITVEQAFIRWRRLVEDMGVSVYVEPFGQDDSRGVSMYFNAFPAIIIDQREKNVGARNFTLFHEFCHLLIRQAGISNFSAKNSVEAFCNKFAASFLMPRKAIEAAFPYGALQNAEPSIAELNIAANKLCVTLSQLSLRIEDLGLVKQGYFNKTIKVIAPAIKKKKPAKVPYKYTYLSRYGNNLPETILSTLDRGTISAIEAGRILELSPANFANVRKVIKDRS